MSYNLAINGFGRIGRSVFRAWAQRADAQEGLCLSAINELADAETVAHLARYDSTHGRFRGDIALAKSALIVDGNPISLISQDDVAALPWGAQGIDLVLECTGAFSDRASAMVAKRGCVIAAFNRRCTASFVFPAGGVEC